MARQNAPESGWPFIIAGAFIAAIGTGTVFIEGVSVLGWILLGLGQILILVGAVAVGVTVGMRRANYLTRFDQQ